VPGKRRVKYFRKCIVECIDKVGASCPEIRELNVYTRCTVKYIDVGGPSRPGVGGLNISRCVF
jgi:hypothetical protein